MERRRRSNRCGDGVFSYIQPHAEIPYLPLPLFALALCCACTSSEAYRSQANELEKQGRHAEALRLLDKAIRKEPTNIRALLDRGTDHAILGHYDSAVADYSMVIALDWRNTLAYVNRGKNKKRMENYAAAITDFNSAIDIKGGEEKGTDKKHSAIINNGYEFDVKMAEIRFERGSPTSTWTASNARSATSISLSRQIMRCRKVISGGDSSTSSTGKPTWPARIFTKPPPSAIKTPGRNQDSLPLIPIFKASSYVKPTFILRPTSVELPSNPCQHWTSTEDRRRLDGGRMHYLLIINAIVI